MFSIRRVFSSSWLAQVLTSLGVIAFTFSLAASLHAPPSSDAVPSEMEPRVQASGVAYLPGDTIIDPDGEAIYQRVCASCHGAQGQGTPGIFPPVSGTEWVTGDEGRLIRVVLHGLEGAIEVKGVTYTRPMPGWAAQFDDEEMAALINFMRTSWENDAEEITPEDVRRVREQHEGKRDAWRPEDFEDEENLGIPNDDA